MNISHALTHYILLTQISSPHQAIEKWHKETGGAGISWVLPTNGRSNSATFPMDVRILFTPQFTLFSIVIKNAEIFNHIELKPFISDEVPPSGAQAITFSNHKLSNIYKLDIYGSYTEDEDNNNLLSCQLFIEPRSKQQKLHFKNMLKNMQIYPDGWNVEIKQKNRSINFIIDFSTLLWPQLY